MAKRNTSGSSSGRRGSSRNRKEDSSSSRGNSGKPFKKSSTSSRPRSRDDEGSFGKKPFSSRPKRDDQRGDSRPDRRSSGKSGFASKRSEDRGYSSRGEGDFKRSSSRGGSSYGQKRRSDDEGSSSRGGERSGFRKGGSSFAGKRRSDDQGGDFKRSSSRGGSSYGQKRRSDDEGSSSRGGERSGFRKGGSSFGGKRGSGDQKFSSRGDKGFRKDSREGGFKKRDSDDGDSSERKQYRDKRFSGSKEEGNESQSRGLKRSNEFSSGRGKGRSDDEGSSERKSYGRRSEDSNERTERPVRGLRKSIDEEKGSFKKRPRFSEKSSPGDQPDLKAPVQTGKIRLNKYIANSGVCSRREADELIKMGLVSVNGKTITEMGFQVNPGDEVRYENKVLTAEKPVYILMNKPKGYLTTTDDPQERNTVMHIIGGAVKERIYPVGRLDRNTTGLLLLTNDGDLAEKLMHPSYNVKKIYKVELDRPFTKADFEKVQEGVVLEEGRAAVDDVAIVSDDSKTVGVEIHIGWNRVVRRIFEALGYEVVRLDRSVYAGLDKKDLGRGQWRFLKKDEIVRLKHLQ